ncbi:UvrD-helicase domain-containing protein [Nitrincola sp. MINF-07-Sa-05]|uniref:UvrD-helicase domain-containing protein n=1 Tax=Nitrincola salilacus TaxID=3400273 RepID=UPI003918402E
MAETRLKLEPEVQTILGYIDEGKNFLLSGGAGSGKTYSLVHTIAQIIEENPTAKISCMTYTNAAVREIQDRFNNPNLTVSTIHDFLWDSIKSFQGELKSTLITLINSEDVKEVKSPDGEVEPDFFEEKEIQYKEYTIIKEGIISHDELLVLAQHMFMTYPKLCDILKDKFKFILIDEYQDTSPSVIEIFLTHFKKSNRKNIIGFFGDAMQSIYDDTIGNLASYVAANDVTETRKAQNRRNPKQVYELANKLRTDGIVQEHSTDENAPNMENGSVKEGNVKFYYTTDEERLEALKQTLEWDFSNPKKTKILNLTHNLIAPQAGFTALMAIYDGDKILDYKKRITDYIKKNTITEDFSELTFGQVIDKLLEGKTSDAQKKPILPTAGMQTFIDQHNQLFETAKSYPFEEFRRIYVDKDALLDDKKDDENDESKTGSKRDNLIKHLFKIQDHVNLYNEKKYNEFLRKTEFQIKSIADKKSLRDVVMTLQSMSDSTIEEVIEYAHNNGICRKDDNLQSFIEKKKYIYDQVIQLKFQEFQNLFSYLEGYTPFSTQHKIKGSEFDNVLVVLDNGNWAKYNFQYLFENNGTESVRERTQKLFYVCCTRSKENLVVYYHNPSQATIATAKNWFGEDNVQVLL